MPKLTLNRVFLLSLLGLLAGLGMLFWLVFHGLQIALLRSAEQARDTDSAVIGQNVTDYLDQARTTAENFESLLSVGLTHTSDLRSLRDGLLSVLLENSDISEATFTFAKRTGFDPDGYSIIDPASAGQVTLYRARLQPGFVERFTWYQDGHYLSTRSHLYLTGSESAPQGPDPAPDPTASYTFKTPAKKLQFGQLDWTDLHWSGVDAALPLAQRRVEVSVLKALDGKDGQFAGVLRVGLFKDAIDKAVDVSAPVESADHSIFLCDNEGRLVAISGSSENVVDGDDVRVSQADAPPQVMAALRLPVLRNVDEDHTLARGQFRMGGSKLLGLALGGTDYLFTYRDLPATQGWIVGVVVPSRAYLGDLWTIRAWVVRGSLILAVAIACFGGIVLHGVSRAHSIILREAGRMNDFVLEPSNNSSRLWDIDRVLSSLERAKTAMRSMGKYVPVDLVRRLYHRGEEPRLGGESTELSVLFSDIQGFTAFAEASDPDTVAARLGSYMHVMATVIQGGKGTIDKFIGDSVMAFWNAPEPVNGHAAYACRAALACREALAQLYHSPDWDGASAFETRFGLHHCVASVGHFGSPERFNYTAIGDGINLASRLESLNKHYGTTIIVSAGMRAAAGPGFTFRRLDRVSVKGKSESLDIYELIGDAVTAPPPWAAAYEEALTEWLAGNFPRALALVEPQLFDPPSAFLAERCRLFIATPPAAWRGIYTFDSK